MSSNFQNQVFYWAHMLDETKHQSYYDVYMQANPKDKMPVLIDSMIAEFTDDLKKYGIDPSNCIKNNDIDELKLEEAQKKIAFKYDWGRISAQTYAAIITRYVAMMDAAKGQRYLSELDYSDVRRGVSRKVIEECLDIVCHNTNVLEANNLIVNSLDGIKAIKNHEQISQIFKYVESAFEKHGLKKMSRYSAWTDKKVEDYYIAVNLYKAWAAYGKGDAGEPYICDSDNGPQLLKNVLRSCEYDADDIELITTLNKAIDVVHFRSDLALAFLEGGQKTAALVSNLPKEFVV